MDDLSFSLYMPLVIAGIVYGLLFMIGRVLAGREDERGERVLDLAFGVALLAGAYTLVLLIISLVSLPDLIWDMLVIVLVVAAFFAILLLVLFAIFELIFWGGERRALGRVNRQA